MATKMVTTWRVDCQYHHAPKALIKTFVKSKDVELIDTVWIFVAWLTAVTFVFATIPEPASKLSIYGYQKDPRAGNSE